MLIFPAVQRFGFAYRESQLVESRLTELHQQHDELTVKVAEGLRYRDYLRTAEAQEAQARHAGFHRQGEQVYLLSSDNP